MRIPYTINSVERSAAAWGSELAVDAAGLEKAYGEVEVLSDVNLQMTRGSVLALLGPNGAGKTTTVRILSTLIPADAGQARVAGFDVTTEPRQVRRRISLTGQYAALDELQTGEENLRMVGVCGAWTAVSQSGAPTNCSVSSTSSTPAAVGSAPTRVGCAGAWTWR